MDLYLLLCHFLQTYFKGGIIFFGRGVPIADTPITDTPYPLPPKRAKIVLKSVFLKKNKHTISGHLVTSYILVIKNFMTPQYIGDPHSEENDSPQ